MDDETSGPPHLGGGRHEILVQEIRRRIIRRAYFPGQRLVERELAAEFNVSRSAVRDALNNLAQSRLVVRSPNRGAEVARLGGCEIRQIYEVREAVEGLLVRLATERAPDRAWNDLVELFGDRAQQAVRSHDVEAFSRIQEEFSARTIKLAQNPVLAEIQSTILDRIAVLVRRALYLPGRMEAALDGQRKVLAAMASRRPDEAERFKRENLRAARDRLLTAEEFIRA